MVVAEACRARLLRGVLGALALCTAFGAVWGLACAAACFVVALALVYRPGADGLELLLAPVGGARADATVGVGEEGAEQELRCRTLHGVEYIHRRRDVRNRNGHNGHVVRIFMRRIFPLPIYGTAAARQRPPTTIAPARGSALTVRGRPRSIPGRPRCLVVAVHDTHAHSGDAAQLAR